MTISFLQGELRLQSSLNACLIVPPPSKAQYETRLKKWKFRKYAKKDEWRTLDRVLKVRKAQGKDTEVVLYGERVTPEKVRKEIMRHRFHTIPYHKNQGNASNTSA